jgi:hypothetical protein
MLAKSLKTIQHEMAELHHYFTCKFHAHSRTVNVLFRVLFVYLFITYFCISILVGEIMVCSHCNHLHMLFYKFYVFRSICIIVNSYIVHLYILYFQLDIFN